MQVIRVGTLIDGSGAPPVRDASVVIDNGRIEAVTTADPSGRRPAGAETGVDVIDASRLTAVPGLIDCHDHLSFHGYELAKRWGLDEPQSTWHLRTATIARQILESGYTAVRDAGGLDAGFGLAIRDGLITGPRLVVSLAIISPTGGLGDRVSPSGHTPPGSHDPSVPPSVADGVEAVRATVRTMVRAGADVIKCADTGGHGHPNNALELEHLVAAGLTPMQALQAATSRAAACLGLEHELGTIEKGKWADLILVDGDPLKDIRLLQDAPRIKRVVKGGVTVISRS